MHKNVTLDLHIAMTIMSNILRIFTVYKMCLVHQGIFNTSGVFITLAGYH